MLHYIANNAILCTLGVFPALAFAADFPPVAPKFLRRTHCICLKNLDIAEKNLLIRSSTKRFQEHINTL